MKNKILILSSLIVVMLLTGCVAPRPHGVVYSDYTVKQDLAIAYPSASGQNVANLKCGKSFCKGYVGNLVAIGDASVAAAMKNGGIKTVHFVDWKVKSVIGLVEEYECIVYGE